MPASKIGSIDSIAAEIRALQAEGKRVVFTNGCFDILHPGHIELLRNARGMGDCLAVAINSDASVRRIKGNSRPIFNEQERSELLASLEVVDFVFIFEEDTPLEAILKTRPDVLVKGADWEHGGIVGQSEVESRGGKAVALPLVEGESTTAIIDRVLERFKKLAH